MTLRLQLVASVCLATFVATCRVASNSEPHRCLEGINLVELVQAEEHLQEHPQGWSSTSMAVASENRVFDGEQGVVLVLDDPSPLLGRLCGRLKDQLAEHCDVKNFWSGPEHCAAFLVSPDAEVNSSQGIYTKRPVQGRVALFASKTTEGKTEIVLTATEWSQ